MWASGSMIPVFYKGNCRGRTVETGGGGKGCGDQLRDGKTEAKRIDPDNGEKWVEYD